MLFEMAGGNRLTLIDNKRSDEKLFKFYTTITDDLQAELKRARQMFPRTKRKADYTLTMSHEKRVRINTIRNLHEKSKDALFLKAPPPLRSGNQPQDMWIWPGIQLIGAGSCVKKGVFVRVEKVGEKILLDNGQELTHDQTVKSLRLTYALCYASCQGLTLKGVVRLFTNSLFFTKKHLYVGASRCTNYDLLEII
jgi:hypothetical protein